MKGEGLIKSDGSVNGNISDIGDPVIEAAAKNEASLSFAIDKTNGSAYKVLRDNASGEKKYYEIKYKELNRFINMNEEAMLKYKKITNDNWMNV